MSRSARATRYAPPPGFVITTSRDPGVEVYAPATTLPPGLCAGCGGSRSATPCLRCGEVEHVAPRALAATLDRQEARELGESWLAEVVRPAPEALQALDRLALLEVPCAADGSTLGVLPPMQLPRAGEGSPTDHWPALERPLVGTSLYVVPVWAASFERDGRTGWLVIDATDGRVSGDRPVDPTRLRLFALVGLLPGALLGFCVGTPALLLAGFGLLIWAAALALLVLGHVRWARLERRAYGAQRW